MTPLTIVINIFHALFMATYKSNISPLCGSAYVRAVILINMSPATAGGLAEYMKAQIVGNAILLPESRIVHVPPFHLHGGRMNSINRLLLQADRILKYRIAVLCQ